MKRQRRTREVVRRTTKLLPIALILALATACIGAGGSSDDSAHDASGGGTSSSPLCTTHRISGDGVGPLRIGMTVDSVSLVCAVARDTIVRDSEGMMSRVLSVPVGSDTVFAEVVDARVWRILVRSQGLFTADSLSVGSSIATLVELPSLNPMVGEGYLYVATPAHCGMSFRLSVPPSTLKSGEWTNAELQKLDPTVHVTRILLLGCRQPPQ
jgi:hypothetical protein